MNARLRYDFAGCAVAAGASRRPGPASNQRLKELAVRTYLVDTNLADTNERRQENYRGLRTTPIALRLRGARAPHRRSDDEASPRQAPPGLRHQSQRCSRETSRTWQEVTRGAPQGPRQHSRRRPQG